MTVEEAFDQLLVQRLNLTKLCKGECEGDNDKCDICKVSSAHKALAEALIEKLKVKPTDDEEKNPSTFLTGSYKRHTMNRPPKDVDFFVVLDSHSYRDEELDKLITPKKLLDRLEKTLSEIAEDMGLEVERQEHSVTVIYDDEFSVDVIPAFETDDGKDYLIACDTENIYMVSNPKKHVELIDRVNAQSEKVTGKKRFKRLARIIKSLKRDVFNDGDLKLRSFHLELAAADMFSDGKIYSYALGLEQFLRKIQVYLRNPGLPDPANKKNLVDDYFSAKSPEVRAEIINIFSELADIASGALEVEKEGNTEAAIKAWGKVIPSMGAYLEEKKVAGELGTKINKGSVFAGSSSLGVNLSYGERKVVPSASWGKPE